MSFGSTKQKNNFLSFIYLSRKINQIISQYPSSNPTNKNNDFFRKIIYQLTIEYTLFHRYSPLFPLTLTNPVDFSGGTRNNFTIFFSPIRKKVQLVLHLNAQYLSQFLFRWNEIQSGRDVGAQQKSYPISFAPDRPPPPRGIFATAADNNRLLEPPPSATSRRKVAEPTSARGKLYPHKRVLRRPPILNFPATVMASFDT